MEFKVHIDVNDEGEGVLTSTHLDVIREYFSVENEKRNHIRGGKKFLPAREYCITKDGRFNIGLLNEIFNYSKKLVGVINQENFVVTPRAKYFYEPSFLIPEDYELADFKRYTGFDYRDIQVEALTNILRRGRGVIEVGTAGGKGLVMASICKTLSNYNPSTTFAILVPTHLVDKTLREFVDKYGFVEGSEISAWDGDNELQPRSQIVILGAHIINTREEEFTNHIANRSVFMIDECHIVKREGKVNERMKLVKTNNIIGLTGSLPEKQMDKLNVLGVIGKVVCKITSRDIKDKGLKADSKVVSICMDGCNAIVRKKSHYEIDGENYHEPRDAFVAEKEYHLRNKGRTECVMNVIEKICGDGNVLIPVDLDFHEKILLELLKRLGRKVFVINGTTPKKDRSKIYEEMENETNAILVAKVGVMREGISINNLSYMIGFFIQKSFVRIVQLIGRIERHGGNEIPVFYDFWDTTPFSSKHFKKRKEIYAKEKIELIEKSVKIDYNKGQFE